MQKKLLTLAVAAAMAAPAAALAEATLYGKLNMSIDYADVDNAVGLQYETDGAGNIRLDANGNPITSGGESFDGFGISREGDFIPGSSRANRLGVKGSEDLGNGLKAIYQVELGLNFAAGQDDIGDGGDGISYRNSFVGLAGNWGTVLVGRHDTPYKISTGKLDQFSDTMADFNGTVGFDDQRTSNTVAYISPNFSGFSFAGAVIAPGGATAGQGNNINSDSLAEAFSIAAIYSNGPFYASAAYESMGSELGMDTFDSLNGSTICTTTFCNDTGDDYTKWKISLGLLDWNGFTLAAIYSQQDDRFEGQRRQAFTTVTPGGVVDTVGVSGVKDQSLWQIQAGYAFGNNKVKAMYGSVDRDDGGVLENTRDTISINNLRDDLEGDRNTWAIGFDHNFSKRTKAYVLYTAVDDDRNDTPGFGINDGRDWDGFSLGMIHKF
ncbi:MAG: porin [Gammaproteobacteria bacterium]|jgi:predicted porin|nr:porin [Gammaproteobacteria bacterium]